MGDGGLNVDRRHPSFHRPGSGQRRRRSLTTSRALTPERTTSDVSDD
jgi:hypothetical protein